MRTADTTPSPFQSFWSEWETCLSDMPTPSLWLGMVPLAGAPATLGEVLDAIQSLEDTDEVVHALLTLHHEGDVAVVDEESIPGTGVGRQPLVRGRHTLFGALDIGDGDGDPVALDPLMAALDEPAEPDLGALEVGEHAHRSPELLRSLTDIGQVLCVG